MTQLTNEQFDAMLKNIKNIDSFRITPEKYAEIQGYRLNEKVLSAVNKCDGYCPCRIDSNDDTKCPCKWEREEGKCICRLYIKNEK